MVNIGHLINERSRITSILWYIVTSAQVLLCWVMYSDYIWVIVLTAKLLIHQNICLMFIHSVYTCIQYVVIRNM